MSDMVNVKDLVFHSSPDPKLFIRRVNLKSVTFNKELGISFKLEPDNWPDYVPPNWQGPIHCTLWAGFFIDNVPHVAGFVQFHRGLIPKIWSGAPILKVDIETNKLQWNKNWAYDNRWAPLNNYAPRAGNRMILFVTAGNARKGSAGPEPDITTVAERTNIVVIDIPPVGADRTFNFDSAEAEPSNDNTSDSSINQGDPTQIMHLATAVRDQIKVLSELVTTIKDLSDAVNSLNGGMDITLSELAELKKRQDDPISGKILGIPIKFRPERS